MDDMENLIRDMDIHTLLPQKDPFVMVGQMEHFSDKKVVTSTKIAPNNIFVENGLLTSSGLIENMAQTCAARIGFINTYILKKGVQAGFIGAVRDFVVYRLPHVNDTIETEINVLEEVFGMVLISARIMNSGEVCATAELKIAIKDND